MGNPRLKLALGAAALITVACLSYGLLAPGSGSLAGAAVLNLALVAGIGYGYLRWNAPKKGARLRDLEAAAKVMALAFDPKEILPREVPIGALPLFDRGDPKVIGNSLRGTWPPEGGRDAHEVWAFDYIYRPRGAADTARVGRTVAAYHLPGGRLPRFSMRPEGPLLGRLTPGEEPGLRFEGDEAFSRRFRLRGPDKEAVRALFHEGIRRYFASRDQAWCVEGEGEWLVLCPDGDVEARLRAGDLRPFLEEAAAIRRFFVG
ncbi:MAG: hypothetical protein KC466_09815 [Myxococcales bacterium]|nr:hypothetical protein [Myxococcales bacterium]